MTQPLLLGLAGSMGSGKTTVADHFAREHGFHGPLNFADPLKDALCAMLGVDRDALEVLKRSNDPVFAGRSVRYALQTLGTEWGRQNIAPDVWLRLMDRHLGQIESWQPCPAGMVIADIRFENEADFIRARGGIVIHVRRDLQDDEQASTHISEFPVAIHEDDFTLRNDGSLQDLYRAADNLVARIRGFAAQPSYLPRKSA